MSPTSWMRNQDWEIADIENPVETEKVSTDSTKYEGCPFQDQKGLKSLYARFNDRWMGLSREDQFKLLDCTMVIFGYGPRVCFGRE
jgi:hypothetical protein